MGNACKHVVSNIKSDTSLTGRFLDISIGVINVRHFVKRFEYSG